MFGTLSQKNTIQPQEGGSKVSRFLSWIKWKIVDLLGYKQAKEEDMLYVQRWVEVDEVTGNNVEINGRVYDAKIAQKARVAKGWVVENLSTQWTAELDKATVQTMTVGTEWTAEVKKSKVGKIRWGAKIINIRAGSKVERIEGADVVNVEAGAEVGEIVGTAEVTVAKWWTTWKIIDARSVFHQWKAGTIEAKDVYATCTNRDAIIRLWWIGAIWWKADFVSTDHTNPKKGADIQAFGRGIDTIHSFNPRDRINLQSSVWKVDVYGPMSDRYSDAKTLRGKFQETHDAEDYRKYRESLDGLNNWRRVDMSPSVKDQTVNYYGSGGYSRAA